MTASVVPVKVWPSGADFIVDADLRDGNQDLACVEEGEHRSEEFAVTNPNPKPVVAVRAPSEPATRLVPSVKKGRSPESVAVTRLDPDALAPTTRCL